MKYPTLPHVIFEENKERFKLTFPLQRNWFLFALFSVSLIIWVVMLILISLFIIQDVLPEETRFRFWLTVFSLIWVLFWYYMGRSLWKQWQFYAADREIVFVNDEEWIIRRPVSILGITTVYDRQHITPLYYSDEHTSPAFIYGYRHVYFASHLPEAEGRKLVNYLNARYFPDYDEDDD